MLWIMNSSMSYVHYQLTQQHITWSPLLVFIILTTKNEN